MISKNWRNLLMYSILLILVLANIIPIRLVIARLKAPKPQAILVLGGGKSREIFTSQLAKTNSELPIFISSGIPISESEQIFQRRGIDLSRVTRDRRATDTVTNFTTIVSTLQNNQIEHIYLVTSDFHLPRAKAIAFFVLGSQGITFTPLPVSSKVEPESSWRIFRDVGRSIFWIITGRTGSSLEKFFTFNHFNHKP